MYDAVYLPMCICVWVFVLFFFSQECTMIDASADGFIQPVIVGGSPNWMVFVMENESMNG